MRLAPPIETRPRTKQQFVYRTLRDAIMRCELKPGQRVVIGDLARQLDVSIIPVREALQMLRSEGLVQNVPHVGVTVAPISRESVLDVFSVLEGLEVVASRLVAERRDPQALAALEAVVLEMDQALAASARERWAELNSRFHLAIGTLPGLPMLRDNTERVVWLWDRVRRHFFCGVLAHRVETAQREHHAIMDAMRAGDLAALEAAVRGHNRGALAAYLEYLDRTEPRSEDAPAS